MDRQKKITGALLLSLSLVAAPAAFAAKVLDLNEQKVSVLRTLITANKSVTSRAINLKEIARNIDARKNLHVRIQQTFSGYEVWGSDAILHIPNGSKTEKSLANLIAAAESNDGSMSGTVYQDIAADLANTPAYVLSDAQKQKAIEQAISNHEQSVGGKPEIENVNSSIVVYVDKDTHKAHWAYQVSFDASAVREHGLPAKPVYVMDAKTFQVYEDWDDIKTIADPDADASALAPVSGGGFGGNKNMGQIIYDGGHGHFPKLDMMRDNKNKLCYLQNANVTVKRCTATGRILSQCKSSKSFTVKCDAPDLVHNGVYWNGDSDAVNGGYSPSNDSLYEGAVIKNMYKEWYGEEVLTEKGKPMMLDMIVHVDVENAYWNGSSMNFGDGGDMFYPLTSLDVAAHEISHGFTQQHSGLKGKTYAGGLNESFSDMAAQAAQYYSTGTNNWQIGPELMKSGTGALRYMDQPSKDCSRGKQPGDNCSIDRADQYKKDLDVHFTCGVFNRAFYLITKSFGNDTKKSFKVMLEANKNYWTSDTNFDQAACGVVKAARKLDYSLTDIKAIQNAFTEVAIDTSKC